MGQAVAAAVLEVGAGRSFGIAPREGPPVLPWSRANVVHQPFMVWGCSPHYLEDPNPWKCLAAFHYLTEALDYVGYCTGRGSEVYLQTDCDVTRYRAGHKFGG